MSVNSLGSHDSIIANLSGELRAQIASITSQYGLSDVTLISKNGKYFLEIGGQLVEVIIVNGKIIPADTFDGLNSQPEAFFEESGFEPFDSNLLSAAPISQAGLEEVIIVNGEIIPAVTFDSLNSQPGAFFEESGFEPFNSNVLSSAPINRARPAQDLALFSFASIGMLAHHSSRSGDTQNPPAQPPATQNPPAQPPATQNPPAQPPATQNPPAQPPATQNPPAQPPATQTNKGPIPFSAAGREYTLITEPMTFAAAQDYAASVGSRLVSFSDASDYDEFYDKLDDAVTNNAIALTTANDGGGAKYVWLGATDQAVEGNWVWEDGQSLSTTAPQWGSSTLGNEPDNFGGIQDGLALGMTDWPIGVAGQWNDVHLNNKFAFVIEKLPFDMSAFELSLEQLRLEDEVRFAIETSDKLKSAEGLWDNPETVRDIQREDMSNGAQAYLIGVDFDNDGSYLGKHEARLETEEFFKLIGDDNSNDNSVSFWFDVSQLPAGSSITLITTDGMVAETNPISQSEINAEVYRFTDQNGQSIFSLKNDNSNTDLDLFIDGIKIDGLSNPDKEELGSAISAGSKYLPEFSVFAFKTEINGNEYVDEQVYVW